MTQACLVFPAEVNEAWLSFGLATQEVDQELPDSWKLATQPRVRDARIDAISDVRLVGMDLGSWAKREVEMRRRLRIGQGPNPVTPQGSGLSFGLETLPELPNNLRREHGKIVQQIGREVVRIAYRGWDCVYQTLCFAESEEYDRPMLLIRHVAATLESESLEVFCDEISSEISSHIELLGTKFSHLDTCRWSAFRLRVSW